MSQPPKEIPIPRISWLISATSGPKSTSPATHPPKMRLPSSSSTCVEIPFVAVNADYLQTIAWALLALQLLSIVIGTIAKTVSTPEHPLRLSAGFSINGWLAVLLTFLLARVFEEGALMREDLSGTV